MKNFRRCFCLLVVVLMATIAFASNAFADTATYVVQTSDGQKLNLHDATTGKVLDSLPNGTKLEVIRIERGEYYRAYVEYEGVTGLYVYAASIVPLDSGDVTKVDPPKKETVYSTDGTMLYRVKLDVKKWVNIQNEKDVNGGTAKHIYRGEYVNVLKIKGKWATVILANGHKRYVEARFLEPVTEWTEPLANPLGEYIVTSDTLNVRTKPSAFVNCRKKLKAGEHVWIVEDLGAWAKVANKDGKEIGYVMTLFLEPVVQLQGFDDFDDEEIYFCQLLPECTCCSDCSCGCQSK